MATTIILHDVFHNRVYISFYIKNLECDFCNILSIIANYLVDISPSVILQRLILYTENFCVDLGYRTGVSKRLA